MNGKSYMLKNIKYAHAPAKSVYELPAVQAIEDMIAQRGVGTRGTESIDEKLDSGNLQIGGLLII